VRSDKHYQRAVKDGQEHAGSCLAAAPHTSGSMRAQARSANAQRRALAITQLS